MSRTPSKNNNLVVRVGSAFKDEVIALAEREDVTLTEMVRRGLNLLLSHPLRVQYSPEGACVLAPKGVTPEDLERAAAALRLLGGEG